MVILAALAVCLDQWTKYLVVQNVPLHSTVEAIPGLFHITYYQNTGAAWSMLEGQTWFFMIMVVIFLVLVVLAVWKKWISSKFELLCVAGIAGGAIGNFIDRLFIGSVTDMICLDFISFPIFNVADSFITVCCILLAIYVIFFDRKKKTVNDAETETTNTNEPS